MSLASGRMELREVDIRKHYPAATAMLQKLDHTPRIAKATEIPVQERAAMLGTRRRFRTSASGLAMRSGARAEDVHLLSRIENVNKDDPIISPLQATVMNGLRRALAIALAIGDAFSDTSDLGDLKRANLQGSLPAARKSDFTELLQAEALVVGHVFANALAFLLGPHETDVSAKPGEVEEVLTDNARLILHGALWEMDRNIAAHADDDAQLVATVAGFAEELMTKLELRAQTSTRIAAFASASWRVEADGFIICGLTKRPRPNG